MITKKRDQPHHDLAQQYLLGLILNMILGIIRELGDPYDVKPGLGGMTAYPPTGGFVTRYAPSGTTTC